MVTLVALVRPRHTNDGVDLEARGGITVTKVSVYHFSLPDFCDLITLVDVKNSGSCPLSLRSRA